jgi:hypothetical protein
MQMKVERNKYGSLVREITYAATAIFNADLVNLAACEQGHYTAAQLTAEMAILEDARQKAVDVLKGLNSRWADLNVRRLSGDFTDKDAAAAPAHAAHTADS